jgi:hypothetical protein
MSIEHCTTHRIYTTCQPRDGRLCWLYETHSAKTGCNTASTAIHLINGITRPSQSTTSICTSHITIISPLPNNTMGRERRRRAH